jgi:hypothetical protein
MPAAPVSGIECEQQPDPGTNKRLSMICVRNGNLQRENAMETAARRREGH